MPKFSILTASLVALLIPYSHQEDVPVDPVTLPIPPMSEYVPSDPQYPKDFRIMDCWQCFQAKGKMCKDKDHQLLHHHVQSSKSAVGFCCKPDNNEGYCEDGGTHGDIDGEKIEIVCSPPSFVKDFYDQTPAGKWTPVLTSDTRNHQMFAFCPRTEQSICGFPNAQQFNHDMVLKAKPEKAAVQVNKMAYHPQGRNPVTGKIVFDEDAEYDACYYEVQMDQSILEKYDATKLNVKITAKSSQIDAFIYQGKSRKESTKSVTPGNVQVQVGQSFDLKPDEGFLIVAYPKDDAEGDFGFEYWVDATLKQDPNTTPTKPEDNKQPENNEEEKVPENTENKPEEQQKPKPKPEIQQKENFEEIREQIEKILLYGIVPLFGLMILIVLFATCICKDKVKSVMMTNMKIIDQNYGYLKKHDFC